MTKFSEIFRGCNLGAQEAKCVLNVTSLQKNSHQDFLFKSMKPDDVHLKREK